MPKVNPINFLTLLLSVTGLLLGCAGIATSTQPTSVLSVSAREPLFVALPVVPDSVDTLLSQIGWVTGRFAQELRKELIFQFHKKGMGTIEDSAAKSTLALTGAPLSESWQGLIMIFPPSTFAVTAQFRASISCR